jgi:hypothetical protein
VSALIRIALDRMSSARAPRSGGSPGSAADRGFFVMAIALAGYVGTMLAALIVLVMAWHQVIGPAEVEKVRQPSHPIGTVAAAPNAAPANPPGQWGPPVVHTANDGADAASADEARAAAEKQAAADAEKAKRQRQAYAKKRKEQLARQQQEPQTALGYDQERSSDQQRSQDFSSGPFSLFGPRRF